jgi:lysophospholipase L1-like esterase
LRLRYHDPNREIIIFFGDSRAKAWPPPSGFSQFEFINRGISFDTSTHLLQRFARHIKPLSPDYVIVQIGVNDFRPFYHLSAGRETIVTACKKNIEQLVTHLVNIGATVILTTIFPVRRETLPDTNSPTKSFCRVRSNGFSRERFWSPAAEAITTNYPSTFGWQTTRSLRSFDMAQVIKEMNTYILSLARPDVIAFDACSLLVGDQGFIHSSYARDALHINSLGYAVLNRELSHILTTHLQEKEIIS